MAGLDRALSPAADVPDELSDPGHLLDRPADAAQSPRPLQPQPFLDSSRLSVCSYADPLFHHALGRVSALPHGPARLLGQPAAARRYAVLELGVRHCGETGEK